jgi:hypothetical protein
VRRPNSRPRCSPTGRREDDLTREAAERAAGGENFFAARADLAVELTSHGYSEIVRPQHYDPRLWDAIESGDAARVAEYLTRAERTSRPIMWTAKP